MTGLAVLAGVMATWTAGYLWWMRRRGIDNRWWIRRGSM